MPIARKPRCRQGRNLPLHVRSRACNGGLRIREPALRTVCTIELARPPRNLTAARSVGAAVFDVLDEYAQFGQDLTSVGVI
jgi:hypothetical protein